MDDERGLWLVIERKSIAWPTEYAYRHSNDHVVIEIVSHELEGLPMECLYELRLPMLLQGSRKEVTDFASGVGKAIRARWDEITSGTCFKGRSGACWWRFGKVPEWEREDEEPTSGLKVAWIGRGLAVTDSVDPVKPPEELIKARHKIYGSCTDKFTAYSAARRVLVLDPFGALRMENLEFWRNLWTHFPPLACIGEIWSGIFDWVTDTEQDWIFERLYIGA